MPEPLREALRWPLEVMADLTAQGGPWVVWIFLCGQHALEVPGALDHERPHEEAAEEDPDHPRPALGDEVRQGVEG